MCWRGEAFSAEAADAAFGISQTSPPARCQIVCLLSYPDRCFDMSDSQNLRALSDEYEKLQGGVFHLFFPIGPLANAYARSK